MILYWIPGQHLTLDEALLSQHQQEEYYDSKYIHPKVYKH
jgi:hypothetical protein